MILIEKSNTSGVFTGYKRNMIVLIPLNETFYLCMKRCLICSDSLLLCVWHCNNWLVTPALVFCSGQFFNQWHNTFTFHQMPLVSLWAFVTKFIKACAKSREIIVDQFSFKATAVLVLKTSDKLGEGYHIPWKRLFKLQLESPAKSYQRCHSWSSSLLLLRPAIIHITTCSLEITLLGWIPSTTSPSWEDIINNVLILPPFFQANLDSSPYIFALVSSSPCENYVSFVLNNKPCKIYIIDPFSENISKLSL